MTSAHGIQWDYPAITGLQASLLLVTHEHGDHNGVEAIAGEPADVVQIAADYSAWMAENGLPKLFVNAEPGAILIGAVREFCRGWKNQTEVTVPGSHFIQEDSGPAIGRAVADWIRANKL